MKIARVRVTGQLLREVLCFPLGTEIEDVVLTVQHPDLLDWTQPSPVIAACACELRDEDLPPLILPLFREQEPIVFVDWGQK